ncbi:hypothetical protein, partial [Lentilactobacillus parabuchneri]|uniref:hypothetical protein n=1 Tax=Lentilactobacillus parabuchneri TaxID=152331 RepID=UPI001F3DEBD3
RDQPGFRRSLLFFISCSANISLDYYLAETCHLSQLFPLNKITGIDAKSTSIPVIPLMLKSLFGIYGYFVG